MDEFLNELYGTSEIISGDDVEKQAAAEFLVKLAEEEGVNLDELSDDEVGSLLAEIEGDMGKQAAAEPETDEAQEKLAEADFLGRAMAHAYVNELNEIEKSAGRVGDLASKLVGKVERLGGRIAGKNVGGAGQKAYKEHLMSRLQQARGSGMKGRTADRMRAAARREATQKGAKAMKTRARLIGGGALGAGALGAGGVAAGAAKAMGGKDKKSFNEEFEAAARERAYEMLADAGYDVEKVAQVDVDTMALQMLEQAGYQVDWS